MAQNYCVKVEPHCHTLVSAHAHSTLQENLQTAKDKNMDGLCLTNHGPGIPDGAHEWHFGTLRYIPKIVDGIAFFSGIEANIIDYDGSLCVSDNTLAALDWVIASIHTPCLKKSTVEKITEAYIGALNNKFVHCLGHSGQSNYLYDFEEVIKTAKKLNKVIEINNHSLSSDDVRPGSRKNCLEIARLCKKHGTNITVSSDAHYCGQIGDYKSAFGMLESIDFPAELIINASLEKFKNYLLEAKKCIL